MIIVDCHVNCLHIKDQSLPEDTLEAVAVVSLKIGIASSSAILQNNVRIGLDRNLEEGRKEKKKLKGGGI
jgi:hypothetical protein